MKIYFDNVDFQSSSGPNSFARKLASEVLRKGHTVSDPKNCDVQLSFIQATGKSAPLCQRLDGIYFNSEQDWNALNTPIKETYNIADGVVFQSHFNKFLTEKYFGKKEKSAIIHNGTDLDLISKIKPVQITDLDNFENVWSCASSWRPHKRLSENIRYFLECAPSNDCLVVAGNVPENPFDHERVFYCGNLSWENLISLYKRSSHFLHLALMDHCPNVVVDARASGCRIVCSSSGGTKEIAGKNSIIIQDMDWDYLPFKLYEPPRLDFSKILESDTLESSLDISDVTDSYLSFLGELV